MTGIGSTAPLEEDFCEIPARESDAILNRLMDLHPKIIDLSLDRTLDLLDRLGRPQDHLPPVIHVAGTNGKGSTIAYLRAILEAAGLRVHVYTSPHLVRFAERIRLAGEIIAEDSLQALLSECELVNGGQPITFFEITTCAALKAFADTPADVLLLEVGLGGRLDSTNVVDEPACTVITPVSLDHIQFLGDTIANIAGEKAGIQKNGRPCVMAPQLPEAESVIRAHAVEVGADLFPASPLASDDPVLKPGLPGEHQYINAGTAIRTIEILREQGFDISDSAIASGLQRVEWPGRMQRLKQGPVLSQIAMAGLSSWEVWLDGGHNPAAGQVIAEMAKQNWGCAPLHLICGMLNTKDPSGFFTPMTGHVTSISTLSIPGEENSLSAEDLAEFTSTVGITARPAQTLQEAVDGIIAASAESTSQSQTSRILICGSLYLAGRVLAYHQ